MPDQRFPFRNRGHEVSRLEAFSDIVFGFALTLLVVSLEVPESLDELFAEMRGFFGFAICFAILIWLWHAHFMFFRRYAMSDGYTITINAILLFVVLLYVYPLKFVFSLVTGNVHAVPRPGQVSTLFVIYGLGFAGVFLLMVLLYAHALYRRAELDLNAVEVHDTMMAIWMYGSYVVIGVVSAIIAAVAPGRWEQLAGWIYFLIGPISAGIGARWGARRRKVEASMSAATAA